jgi:hypothetical protein
MSPVNTISTAVYYLDDVGASQVILFEGAPGDVLGPALKQVEQLRREGKRHVCISSENMQSVGKPGVAAVEGGKMPDGSDYGWTKRRRR